MKVAKPPELRNRVDLSTDRLTHRWAKRFKTTPESLMAAVQKVGTNATTVAKELKVQWSPRQE